MAHKKKILTESQICKLFNIDDNGLKSLRSKYKLPYIQVDRYRRLYYEHRLFEWLDEREKNVVSDRVSSVRSSDDGDFSSDDEDNDSDD